MKNAWPWIAGIVVGLLIIGLVFLGSSDRQSYWIARETVPRAIQIIHADDTTIIRIPCEERAGSIETAGMCGFYVSKK